MLLMRESETDRPTAQSSPSIMFCNLQSSSTMQPGKLEASEGHSFAGIASKRQTAKISVANDILVFSTY